MKLTVLCLSVSVLMLYAQEPAPGPVVPPATPTPVPDPAPAAVPAPVAKPPAVFILCGSPGDEEHHAVFEKRLTGLRKWFTQRAGLPAADVHVYYGPESAGYSGTAGRENIKLACTAAVELTKAGRPVWFIMMGHANDAPGDVRFNVPGGDLSGKELAGWLTGAATGEGAGTLNLILTTACSGRAVKHLAGPGRSIVAATNVSEEADETVFPEALVQALNAEGADTNKDGALSLTEIFMGARAAVLSTYQGRGYILTEHAGLDGDGDGRATQRPAEGDATAAGTPAHALKLKSSGSS